MAELLRAQVTLAHQSGLPRDNASVNFWFHAPDGADAAAAADVAQRVSEAIRVPVAPLVVQPAKFLSSAILDAGSTIKVYEYDMATGQRLSYAEAPPIHTESLNVGAAGGVTRYTGSPLPSEVAVCASYRSTQQATPGGGNFSDPPARTRGRIYWGPLREDAIIGSFGPRPTTTMRDCMVAMIVGLAAPLETNRFVVYSRPFAGRSAISAEDRQNAGGPYKPLPPLAARTGQAYYVDQASCDDACDTQRRRGERATTRVIQNF